jgi:hypothetical protein
MKRRAFLLAPLLVVALIGAACGSNTKSGDSAASPTSSGKADLASATTKTGASDLRAGLTGLLGEHVFLASEATGAALRGDTKSFEAYAAALNGPTNSNTADLTAAITSAYGNDVGKAFDGLWRSNGHIPAFVAYTQATAKGDKAGQDKALADLTSYAKTFGTTLNSVNSNLPADAVTKDLSMHASTLIAVINAQKAGDATQTATALREAVKHMSGTADVLSEATVQKFPEKFKG